MAGEPPTLIPTDRLPLHGPRPGGRIRRALGWTAGAVAAIAIVGCGSGSDTSAITIETLTPTPPATETPSPTPTPPPTEPVPAEIIPLGESVGLVNPSSIGFPDPPPSTRDTATNRAKILRMVSPGLEIDHYVEDMGITDGQMDPPNEDGNHVVGWYYPTARYKFGRPGTFGNSVFSAHETWNHMQGPLYRLHDARIGDYIYLDLEGGERRQYQIARVTRYDVDEMPMGEILWPTDRPPYEEWITLYTCGGEIIYGPRGFGDYLARDVLVAKYVGSTTTPTTISENPTGTAGAAVSVSTP